MNGASNIKGKHKVITKDHFSNELTEEKGDPLMAPGWDEKKEKKYKRWVIISA